MHEPSPNDRYGTDHPRLGSCTTTFRNGKTLESYAGIGTIATAPDGHQVAAAWVNGELQRVSPELFYRVLRTAGLSAAGP